MYHWGWGHKSIGSSLEGPSPESRCAGHGSRLLARPTPRRVSTKRLKPRYAGSNWQDYTRPFYQGSEGLPPAGLRRLDRACAVWACFGRRYITSQGAPWAKCSLPRLSTVTVLPFYASIRTWKHLPCAPSATRWRIGADATIRAIDLTCVAASHETVQICQNDLGEHDGGERSPARAAVLSRPGVWGGRSLRDG